VGQGNRTLADPSPENPGRSYLPRKGRLRANSNASTYYQTCVGCSQQPKIEKLGHLPTSFRASEEGINVRVKLWRLALTSYDSCDRVLPIGYN